jgi:hypothetical protein
MKSPSDVRSLRGTRLEASQTTQQSAEQNLRDVTMTLPPWRKIASYINLIFTLVIAAGRDRGTKRQLFL